MILVLSHKAGFAEQIHKNYGYEIFSPVVCRDFAFTIQGLRAKIHAGALRYLHLIERLSAAEALPHAGLSLALDNLIRKLGIQIIISI